MTFTYGDRRMKYTFEIKTPGHAVTFRCHAANETEARTKASRFAESMFARMDTRGLLRMDASIVERATEMQ